MATSAARSVSIGYTPHPGSDSATVVCNPPPAYVAGDFLLMVAMGSGAAAVFPSTPAGWTAISAGSAVLGVFYKTAGAESAVTVTFSGSCKGEVTVTAYPPATVSLHALYTSSAEATSFTTGIPGGVTAGQQVVLCAGAIDSSSSDEGNAISNQHNMNLPLPWAWTLMPFGANNDPASNLSSCIGIAEYNGIFTVAPTVTSSQGSTFYALFVVLTIPALANGLSVTVTCSGPAVSNSFPGGGGTVPVYVDAATPGMALTVAALSGAQSAGNIAANAASVAHNSSGVSGAPDFSFTPSASGSMVFGALWVYGVAAGFGPASGTTFFENIYDSGNSGTPAWGTFAYGSTTTAGTPVTLGGTAPVNSYTTYVAAEILAQTTLSQTAIASVYGVLPTDFQGAQVSQTATLTTSPAPGDLLVAAVVCNTNLAATSVIGAEVSDTSGLDWTPLTVANFNPHVSVWIAEVPNPLPTGAPSEFAVLLTPNPSVTVCAVKETGSPVPVAPGQAFSVSAYVYLAGSEPVELGMDWEDASGDLIQTSTQQFTNVAAAEWVLVRTIVTAPTVGTVAQGVPRCGRNGNGSAINPASITYVTLIEVIYPVTTW